MLGTKDLLIMLVHHLAYNWNSILVDFYKEAKTYGCLKLPLSNILGFLSKKIRDMFSHLSSTFRICGIAICDHYYYLFHSLFKRTKHKNKDKAKTKPKCQMDYLSWT